MNLNQIQDIIKKDNTCHDVDGLNIYKSNITQTDEFVTFLSNYLKHFKKDTLESEELCRLWFFFKDGKAITTMMQRVELMTFFNTFCSLCHPFKEFFSTKFDTLSQETINCGVLPFQIAFDYFTSCSKITELMMRYKNIYSQSNNPMDWLKLNDYSPSFHKPLSNEQETVLFNFKRVLKLLDVNFDPFLKL